MEVADSILVARGGKRSTRFVAVCVLAAALLRVTWVVAVADTYPRSDDFNYYTSAIGIAQGVGYLRLGVGAPTGLWPVGYPAFLGGLFRLFGPSLLAPRVANVAMSLAVLPLWYRMARALFASERVARVTLLLATFYPNLIFYCSSLWSETLQLFLFTCGIAVMMSPTARDREPSRGWWVCTHLLAGLLFGLLCLVKPVHLFAPVVYIVGRRLDGFDAVRPMWRTTLSKLVLVYAPILAVTLPWTIRNRAVLGVTGFVSTNGPINLFIGNNPYATGGFDLEGAERILVGTNVDPGKYAMQYMLRHPGRTLHLAARKVVVMYSDETDGWWTNLGWVPESVSEPQWQAMRNAFTGNELPQLIPSFAAAYTLSGDRHVRSTGMSGRPARRTSVTHVPSRPSTISAAPAGATTTRAPDGSGACAGCPAPGTCHLCFARLPESLWRFGAGGADTGHSA
jgi:hypothetical protein